MFYPSDFEVKRTKEQEIRERVARAQVDRLLQSIQPRRAGWFARSTREASHWLGHVLLGVGTRLEKLGATDSMPSRQRWSSR